MKKLYVFLLPLTAVICPQLFAAEASESERKHLAAHHQTSHAVDMSDDEGYEDGQETWPDEVTSQAATIIARTTRKIQECIDCYKTDPSMKGWSMTPHFFPNDEEPASISIEISFDRGAHCKIGIVELSFKLDYIASRGLRSHFSLETLWVDPNHRSKGSGTRLFTLAKRIANSLRQVMSFIATPMDFDLNTLTTKRGKTLEEATVIGKAELAKLVLFYTQRGAKFVQDNSTFSACMLYKPTPNKTHKESAAASDDGNVGVAYAYSAGAGAGT